MSRLLYICNKNEFISTITTMTSAIEKKAKLKKLKGQEEVCQL